MKYRENYKKGCCRIQILQKINDIDGKYKRYINSKRTEVEYPTLGITMKINLETREVEYFKNKKIFLNINRETKISLSSEEKREIELINKGYISDTICKTSIITKSGKKYKEVEYPTLGITMKINLETGEVKFFKGSKDFSSLNSKKQEEIIEEVHKYDKSVLGCCRGVIPYELSNLLLIEVKKSECVICVPNYEKPIKDKIECIKEITQKNKGKTVYFSLNDKEHAMSGFATFINGKFYMTLINTSTYRGSYGDLLNNKACIAEFGAQSVDNCAVASPRTLVEFAKQFREKDATQAIISDMEKIRDSKINLGDELRILKATTNAFAIKENYFRNEADFTFYIPSSDGEYTSTEGIIQKKDSKTYDFYKRCEAATEMFIGTGKCSDYSVLTIDS